MPFSLRDTEASTNRGEDIKEYSAGKIGIKSFSAFMYPCVSVLRIVAVC